jgi:hypothetical protein
MIKNFFDILSAVFKKEMPTEEEVELHTNVWMLLSLMSCDEQLAPLAFELSKLKMTKREFFTVLYNVIPKCKKYVRWNATKAKKEEEALILMQHFGCSLRSARQYAVIMDAAELTKIVSAYKDRGLRKG